MTPEEALEAFDYDYNIVCELPEVDSSYFNVDGVYRRSAMDFVPNPHYIDPNIDPRAWSGVRQTSYSPECVAYWRGIQQFCSDDQRLFRRWRSDYGREIYGVGTVLVRSYHNVDESLRWYDFHKSDQLYKRCMVFAREALDKGGFDIAVPEVLFSGKVGPIPDFDPVYANSTKKEPKKRVVMSALLATRRIPGIALDRIIDWLPKEIVLGLEAQIAAIAKALETSERQFDRSDRHGMRLKPTKDYPATEQSIADIREWFDTQWDTKYAVRNPAPVLLQKTSECADAAETRQSTQPTLTEHAPIPAFMEKSTEYIDVYYDAQEHTDTPSDPCPPSSSATVTHVPGNPHNDKAPVYSGVDSDLDVVEGGLTPKNFIVSGGRIVGIQGVAILGLLL